MSDPLLTEDELRALLLAPKRVESRDKVVEGHSIADQIKALEYIESKSVTTRSLFRSVPLSPPGTQ
jgi:hypothetical protein